MGKLFLSLSLSLSLSLKLQVVAAVSSSNIVGSLLLDLTPGYYLIIIIRCRLTAIPQLAHHGILFVPLGYTFGSGMFEIDEVKGGSSYGAGTYAGDGSRQPTELELQQAFYQGKYVAGITKKLKATST